MWIWAPEMQQMQGYGWDEGIKRREGGQVGPVGPARS